MKLKRNPLWVAKEIVFTLELCFSTTLTLAVSRRAKDRSSLVQLSNNNNKRKIRMASPGKQVGVYLSFERI